MQSGSQASTQAEVFLESLLELYEHYLRVLRLFHELRVQSCESPEAPKRLPLVPQ